MAETSPSTDIHRTVSGLMRQHIGNQEKNLEEKKKVEAAVARAKRQRGVLVGVVSVVVIVVAAWLTMERLQPPGFVRILGVTESVVNGTMTVSGKVKNLTPRTISERVWIISYYDPANKKRPVTEAPLVVQGLASGQIKDWSVQVPNWKPGLRLVVRKKEEG